MSYWNVWSYGSYTSDLPRISILLKTFRTREEIVFVSISLVFTAFVLCGYLLHCFQFYHWLSAFWEPSFSIPLFLSVKQQQSFLLCPWSFQLSNISRELLLYSCFIGSRTNQQLQKHREQNRFSLWKHSYPIHWEKLSQICFAAGLKRLVIWGDGMRKEAASFCCMKPERACLLSHVRRLL